MTERPSRLRAAIGYLAIGVLLPWPQLAAAQVIEREAVSPIEVVSREDIEQLPNGPQLADILDLHNKVRSDHGSRPLRWNPMLADSAQEVADRIAQTGNTQHSSRVGRENIRENIVAGPFTPLPPIELAQTWIDELPKFVDGVFPDICTGDWLECSHISQILWSTTTDVGCGYAADDYVALVCHYSPKGNIDGRLVLELRDAPVIAINNAPDPTPVCEVPPAEDWVKILNEAAVNSGFAQGGTDPRDAPTDRQWQLALKREQDVQDRMMTELATLQGNVGTHINAYLAATSAWQENYVYLASSTTTLQGQLTQWLESKEIYEKADLAFGLANLGVGGAKLGFKAYRFLTAPRAAATTTAAGATRVAGAADEVAEAGAAAAGETGIFNRTIIPPGQNPLAPGMRGFAGTTSTAGDVADVLRANWQREVDMMRRLVDEAVASGDEVLAQANRAALDDLLRTGPATSAPVAKIVTAADRVADLDPALVSAAREAGLTVENFATGVGSLEKQNMALMRAIAEARGWHDIPTWVGDAVTNVLIQARKGLAGIDNAPISPQQLDAVRRLKAMADARGINFADWLRKAAGEVSSESGQVLPGATEGVIAIVRYFDDADIDLLLKVIDAGGDLSSLRNAVSPVAQASLNGLGRAAQAGGGGCGALDTGMALQGVGGTLAGAGNAGGPGPAPGGAGAPPSDAQLESVLYGTGKLGEVGLGNVVDQFGVTDRFTAGQGLPRAIAGELWELITSPSATVASHYFTHQAQSEYLNLLQTEGDRMVRLGTDLAAASNALRDLQNTLQRAGLSGPGSYLGTRGPADLRKALDDLEKVYRSGSDQWQRDHKAELDARRDHINQKLAALAETVADLNALAARMAQMRNHLDSLRLDPAGGLRAPVDLFNPIVFVRLGSISLFLRGMGADAFGLSTQPPFKVTPPPPPPSAPAEDFDTMRAREAERWRAIDEAPEVEVETDFDQWLETLPPQ